MVRLTPDYAMHAETIFHEALARSTHQERAEFIDLACAGNLGLLAEVEALLVAYERSEGFLPSPGVANPDWSGADGPASTHVSSIGAFDPTDDRARLTQTYERGAEGGRDAAKDEGQTGFAPQFPKSPERIGRFEIRGELGRGGMGTVYLAHDPELRRLVALKVPKLVGRIAEERFLRESRAAAAVSHPNLCPVYDAGRADGALYLVMAYVPGDTLRQVLTLAGRLPPARASAIAAGVARGMAEAHRNGITHRDLKPGNILFDRQGEPVVTDFGLALQAGAGQLEVCSDPEATSDPDSRLTHAGALMGTPAYMPPEQALGHLDKIGPASDVYALGAILFELLTGSVPFRGNSLADTLQKITCGVVPPMPGVPANLDAICRKALAKEPADRIPSMDAFAAELSAASAARRARTRFRIGVSIATCAFLLLAGVIFYVKSDNGTMEIRLSDPNADVRVTVDGDAVQLSENGRVTRLRAGPHALEVKGDGFETETRLFRVTRGDRLVVEVELKPRMPLGQAPLEPPTRDRAKLSRLLKRGRKMLEENQLDEMGKAVDEALTVDPQSPGALALRAMGRAMRDEFEDARADADAALKLNPEIREALIARAIVHAADGDLDEAIADETAAIRLDPGHPRAWSNRSKSYLDRTDYPQAAADATHAIELELGGADALLCLAAALALQGDFQPALANLNEAARVAPNNWRVFDQRSALHARLGNNTQERSDWSKVLELNGALTIENRPVFPEAPQAPERKELTLEESASATTALHKTQVAWDANHIEDCQGLVDEAFRIDPSSGMVRAWRARLLAANQRFEDADRESTEAIRLDPKISWTYVTRGVSRINLQHQAAGIADLTIALTLNPQDWVAWYNRGLAYMQRGQYQQALADYAEAIRQNPNQPEAFVNRGVCFLSLGDDAAAQAEYNRAIDAQPANGKWRLERGAIRARLGDSTGADADHAAALEIDRALKRSPEITLPTPLPPVRWDP